MRRSHLIASAAVVAALFALAVPVGAVAAPAPQSKASSDASASIPTYNLDWTLPTAGRSGCLVCHEDKSLVRIVNGQTVGLWVDTSVLMQSAHKYVGCTECHTDFAYKTPHETTVKNGQEWRIIAKSSCKNCHNPQFNDYTDGAHSQAGLAGDTAPTVGAPDSSAPGKPRPLCGDCHKGHSVPSKTDTASVQAMRATAREMCGTCHDKATSSYADYYHGAAFQQGAGDAPTCWQCHGSHKVLPSTDRRSMANKDNLLTTCGQCHKGTLNDQYVSYATLIHRKQSVLTDNPVYAVANSARQAISNAFYQVGQVFKRSGS